MEKFIGEQRLAHDLPENGYKNPEIPLESHHSIDSSGLTLPEQYEVHPDSRHDRVRL